jgi:hypothetical protein
MQDKPSSCQHKTANSLATLLQVILGEPLQISFEKPDAKGVILHCIIESETVLVRAEILGEGAMQSISIQVDGVLTNSAVIDFGLKELFGVKPPRANPRSPVRN